MFYLLKRVLRAWPALLPLLLCGCNPAAYKADADREAYCIIGQKSMGIEGLPAAFNIERPRGAYRNGEVDSATLVLTITDCLRIATENSREYRSRMESLYSEALSLSLARHEFDPIYFGQGNFEINNDGTRQSISNIFSLGFNRMLATGADLSVEMSTSLFRIISGGDPSELATSALSVGLVQPLMRGYGQAVTLENLTQSERDMVYAIRDFVRYRKTLTVNITQSYLDLLGQSDQVDNAKNNLESLIVQRDYVENQVLAGRMSPTEADQAVQQVFEARDSWIRAIANYERGLDLFKLQIGIPTELRIIPNPGALKKIEAQPVEKFDLPVEKAVQVALVNRLDLRNTRERVEDYRRKIPVAADLLKPGMDLVLGYGADSDGRKAMFDFADGEKNYSAGINYDLPLDRKSERNTYRQAFINLAAAERDYEQGVDTTTYEVRNTVRNLNLAVDRYDIQLKSLALARKRVERDSDFLRAGRAITRDVLESQNALLSAQNSTTSALIDYFSNRLDLLLAMETLQVDGNGMWKEGIQEDDWEYVDQ
jgi:outer membrane protein TolC